MIPEVVISGLEAALNEISTSMSVRRTALRVHFYTSECNFNPKYYRGRDITTSGFVLRP